MKKILRFILFLIVVYVICKWPDQVASALEWGFVKVWNLVSGLVSGNLPAATS